MSLIQIRRYTVFSRSFEASRLPSITRTSAFQTRTLPAKASRSKFLTQSSSDVVLVKTEERGADTILFTFGTEDEKKAAEKDQPSPSTPSPSTSAPSRQESPKSDSEQLEEAKQVYSKVEEAVQNDTLVEGLDEISSLSGSHHAPSPVDPRVALQGLTVAALKDLCKESQLTGYSKLRKEDLVELLVSEVQH